MNELVERLLEGEHLIEASLRPEKQLQHLKKALIEDMSISNLQTHKEVPI